MSDTTDTLTGPAGQDAEPAAPAAGPAETPAAPAADARPRRRAAGLAGMLLPELQSLATSLGISGVGRMRKGDLVSAIQARQSGNGAPAGEGQAQLPLGGSAPAESAPAQAAAESAPVRSAAAESAAAPGGSAVSAPAESSAAAEPSAAAAAPVAESAPVVDVAPVTEVPAEARPVLTGQPDAAVATGADVSSDTTAAPERRSRQRRSASRPAGSPDATATAAAPEIVAEPAAGTERPADGQDAGSRTERADRGDRTDRGDQRRGRGQRDDDRQTGERTREGDRQAGDRARDGERTRDGERQTGERTRDGDRQREGDRQRDGERLRDDRQRGDDRTRDDRARDDRTRDDRQTRDGDRVRDGERTRDGDRTRDDRTRDDRTRDDRTRDDRQRDGDRDNQRAAAGDRQTQRDGTQRDGQRDGQGAQREDDDDFDGRGGSRRRGRFRDRNRRNRTDRFGTTGEPAEPVIAEDDVLLPVAGILDILDNYAFVRTSGYLTGPNDVYVSLAQVRRHGLRRGDAITGAVRQPREGERRDKYNALVRLDTVNGVDPEQSRNRPEFMKLTPLYPQDRLRLETEPHVLTSRVIDLVMPIGKGQRALIVSPPKAGKTMILQTIANAVTTNNPECHLMVVLVDERPEEVTDMQRAVKGEVIASTFDRPPTDHTTVAELSIERAKRLVELGHDVVVLLDNITRLGRAYNLAAPASGRILSGGVDSTALYPPKRFLGAARNIEHGGSLTILATALIETGSTMDTVIFEEFKGTGNAELILSRKIANKRTFPAVDVIASGTRKEEILLAPEELVIVHKLRRVLNALDPEQAIDLLLDRLKQSRTNVEFLMQIAKSTPGQD